MRLAIAQNISFQKLFPGFKKDTEPLRQCHMCRSIAGCESVSLDRWKGRTLSELVESGKVPKLTYSENTKKQKRLTVHLETLDECHPYVAISHVRADGLGNSERNSLPSCVLRWLQKIVDEMYDVSKHPVPLWIDTLCLPIKRPSRQPAIKHLRQIFSDCDRVLVLESTFYNSGPASPCD